MALRKSSIVRYFKSKDASALFVADGLRLWAVGPSTYVLTMTIKPVMYAGFCVTFAIRGSSDDTSIQTFLDVLGNTYPLRGEAGLSLQNQSEEKEERNEDD